jgi:hypothetical protein
MNASVLRPTAFYRADQHRTLLKTPASAPSLKVVKLRCSNCSARANGIQNGKERKYRVCLECGCALKKRPSVTRRKKSDEVLLHESQQASEKVLTDIGRKMTSLKKHQKRIRYYTAKLEGRLKKSTQKKKTPIRTITVA